MRPCAAWTQPNVNLYDRESNKALGWSAAKPQVVQSKKPRAREVGDSGNDLPVVENEFRKHCRPFHGLMDHWLAPPGANAPGFMLPPAPQAR